ncbi:MAG: hypothetical protein QW734_08945 [Candidatus Bathyarchaeia archaeon]
MPRYEDDFDDEGRKEKEILLTPEAIEVMMREKPKEEKKLEEVFGMEEAIAKMLVELIKSERINLLTDLTFEEIQALVVAEVFGTWLFFHTNVGGEGVSILNDLCELYKELKVSIGRRGRTEIVELGGITGMGIEEKKVKMGGFLGVR